MLEGYQSGTTGQDGAMVSIKGASTSARVSHVNISDSTIGSVSGVTLDGIKLENADHVFVNNNYFNQPAGKVGVRIGSGAVNSYVDKQTNKQYGAAGANGVVSNAADPSLVLSSVKAYEAQQSSAQGGYFWVDKGVFNLGIQPGAISFAAIATNFPTPAAGQTFFCTDCTPGTPPCTGGSAVGALALRTSNGQWSCK